MQLSLQKFTSSNWKEDHYNVRKQKKLTSTAPAEENILYPVLEYIQVPA